MEWRKHCVIAAISALPQRESQIRESNQMGTGSEQNGNSRINIQPPDQSEAVCRSDTVAGCNVMNKAGR